jgi:hypothetical protein
LLIDLSIKGVGVGLPKFQFGGIAYATENRITYLPIRWEEILNSKKAFVAAAIALGVGALGTPAHAGCNCFNAASGQHSCVFNWYICEQSGGSCSGGCFFGKKPRKRKINSTELAAPCATLSFNFEMGKQESPQP